MISQIKSIFVATSQQTRADIEALWKRTGGRGRRWESCTKAAELLKQSRTPAETWIGQGMLGELVRGEITLPKFRKQWAHVIRTWPVKTRPHGTT